MKLLVTGANGFIGSRICQLGRERGWQVREAVRFDAVRPDQVSIGDLFEGPDWEQAVSQMDAVIHCAAMVHRMDLGPFEAEAQYMAVNRDATLSLARSAKAAGVSRMVFISTAMVHGNGRDRAYTESDQCEPKNIYARSKLEAELGLSDIADTPGFSITIIRPPLVYGPGVGANFRALMQLAATRLPLPLGAAKAQRSIVHIDNLADAILTASEKGHGERSRHTAYLVDDGHAPNVAELVSKLREAAGHSANLIAVPQFFMKAAFQAIGKNAVARRLFQPFTVDSSAIREELDWSPPVSQAEGLDQTMRFFLEHRGQQS